MSQRVQQHACDVITQYRDEIYARMPHAAQGALNEFIRNLFGDDDLVRAYLHPVATPAGQPATMPLDLCERAANQARRYPGLLHRHERELAAVAAFVQSCGYHWCAYQQALGRPVFQNAETMRSYRSRIASAHKAFLEEPLRQLRRCHADLGCTLAQVLGMDQDHAADPQQVARIQAALGSVMMQMP
jgi:hypothetical protein